MFFFPFMNNDIYFLSKGVIFLEDAHSFFDCTSNIAELCYVRLFVFRETHSVKRKSVRYAWVRFELLKNDTGKKHVYIKFNAHDVFLE